MKYVILISVQSQEEKIKLLNFCKHFAKLKHLHALKSERDFKK